MEPAANGVESNPVARGFVSVKKGERHVSIHICVYVHIAVHTYVYMCICGPYRECRIGIYSFLEEGIVDIYGIYTYIYICILYLYIYINKYIDI